MELSRVLFCDYDGDFRYADTLTRLGYLVDQIRPESLRAVNVGEHAVYLFSFEDQERTADVLSLCDKLKAAELLTPIVVYCRRAAAPSFLSHAKTATQPADAYLHNLISEAALLDTLDELVGSPIPLVLRSLLPSAEDTDVSKTEQMDSAALIQQLQQRIEALEAELQEVQGEASALDKALEAQRQFYKPKLKAMLEGQKLKVQSETERLKFKLSEVEAKLLDREAHIKELEQSQKNQKKVLTNLMQSHQKAQEQLKTYYQNRMENLGQVCPSPKPDESSSSESASLEESSETHS